VPAATPEQLFGAEIRRVREERGISQEELGFRADLHRTYVSQLERGLKSPSLRAILRIARGLGCPAARLVASAELPRR